jgi:archaellum component FlaC
MNPLQKEFEALAKDIVNEGRKNVAKSISSYSKVCYINDMKKELQALKEAYAVVFTDIEDFQGNIIEI